MAKEVGAYLDELVAEQGEPCHWEQANRMVQEAILRLGKDRQRKYGHGNISKFGLHGIVIRSSDKLERLQTMVWAGSDDVDESIEDSAGDMANYGTYGVLLGRRLADGRPWWELPLLEEPSSEV